MKLGLKISGLMLVMATVMAMVVSCGVYSPYGASTSGATTFTVVKFEPIHPLVSATTALTLTESLIDRVQKQSTLKLVEDGELTYEAKVIDWVVQPVNVQGDETAGANRVTITIDLVYTNTIDSELSFQKRFSRFYDLPSSQDIFTQEDLVVSEIGSLLSQDVFNASLGNW